jgi:hypothetical protein
MNDTSIIMYISNLKDNILEVPNSYQHYLQVKEAYSTPGFEPPFLNNVLLQ